MKANAMVVAAVLVTALVFPAHGQSVSNPAGKPSPTPGDINRFEHNYMSGLTCANDGVVESAIAQSVRMKWALPSAQLEELREALGTLASGGRTVAIRYKASLAGLVFDSPSIFNSEGSQKYAWDEDLFAAISGRAQKALLGYNGDRPRGF